MKFVKTGAALLLAVFICAYVAGALTIPALPDFTQLQQQAEKYDSEILRDDYGVPHIYGNTDADVAFGLAYAHAEDDFATIQDVILATRGKIAAHKGYKAAPTDFLVQFMDVQGAADTGYNKLPEATRAIAEAYAVGLNLYATHSPDEVSPWLLPVKGQDIVAGFTFKTPLFYGFEKVLGKLLSGELKAPQHMSNDGETAFMWTQDEPLPTGSQGIAVAPHRSEDGHTRLLVNSHQPLTGPVAWYEARLKSETGLDIAGSTFPGGPLIIHGHNRHIGWSNTVNKPDLVDVYHLTVDDAESPTQYKLDGQWRDFDKRIASITVKLFGPLRWTVNRDILISEHGPVLQTDTGFYAVRWAGMGETRTLDFLYKINKAESLEEFMSAFEMMAMPSINYVYADAKGNIGHLYNAMMPKRDAAAEWQDILPGDDSRLIWHEYWPLDAIPHTQNPPSGMVYNANNSPFNASEGDGDPVEADFPASMGIETQWTNRALRIEELFTGDSQISKQDFNDYKFDTRYSEQFDVMLTLREFQQAPLADELQIEPYLSAFSFLKDWDLNTDKDNRHAALAVLTLYDLLRFDKLSEPFDMVESFKAAVDLLIAKHGSIDVPFGQVSRHIRGNKNLSIEGGPDILRAVYGGPADESDGLMKNRAGDSYVMFIDWDEHGKVTSHSVHNFGSATLDETSAHYDDQMEMFLEHRLKPVYLELTDLEQHLSRRYRPQDLTK